jgi:hypothetical protein
MIVSAKGAGIGTPKNEAPGVRFPTYNEDSKSPFGLQKNLLIVRHLSGFRGNRRIYK